MRPIFLLIACLFSFSLYSKEATPELQKASTQLEGEHPSFEFPLLDPNPKAVVAGCVNAITGDFFDTSVDLVVPGVLPIVVQRFYSSRSKKWSFGHKPLLRVGPLEEEKKIAASYQDDRGSGSYFEGREGFSLTVPSKMVKKGLTNLSTDEISGQTHFKNSYLSFKERSFSRKEKGKFYDLRHSSLIHRYFKSFHPKGDNKQFGKFYLWKEVHPGGNSLHYSYLKDGRLKLIEAKNKLGEPLSRLKVYESSLNSSSAWVEGDRHAKYHLDNHRLIKASTTDTIPIFYNYDSHNRVKKKAFPEGRALYIDYYNEGKDKHHVKALGAPIGADGRIAITYQFEYEFNDGKKTTLVKDALGCETKYECDRYKRLSTIKRFDSRDTFIWGEYGTPNAGNLLYRYFSSGINHLFCNALEYDAFGNITKEKLYGNCTGKNETPLFVLGDGSPLNNTEVYTKTFKASQEGLNLPLEEHDGKKSLYFSYTPHSSQLKARFTKENKTFLKREFFEYDVNGTLIKEIWDDGQSEDLEDLALVTERHIRVIHPRKEKPMGLPEVIEEFYWENGHPVLLKKVVNEHNLKGELIKQDHYDSQNEFVYSLYWEYDKRGNLLKEVNALGVETFYTYDENNNKLSEVKPNLTKLFTYDLGNRLITETELWENKEFVTTHEYNLRSERIATTDSYGKRTTFEYDRAGRLVKTTLPPLSGNPRILLNSYDAMGNLIQETDANGNTTKKKYTVRGTSYLIEYPDGSKEEKEYDLSGQLVQETAKNGTTTRFTYDALGRAIKTEFFDQEGKLLKSTSSTYNAFQLLSETDEFGESTFYTYDKAGRCTLKTKGPKKTEYFYDSLSRKNKTMEWLDDETALITTHEYDLLNRVIEERIEDNKGTLFKKETYEYDVSGNKIKVTLGEAITQTAYNQRGEPVLITDPLGHQTKIDREYTDVLKEITTDPLGNKLVKIFDQNFLLSQIRENANGEEIQSESYVYDPMGRRLLSKILIYSPNAPPKTIVNQWQYDGMGQVIKTLESDQKETNFCYNLFGQKEWTLTPNNIKINHSYDALGRLTEINSSDNSVHYTFSYNLKDNPTVVKNQNTGKATLRTYDNEGRLISETQENGYKLTYSYDNFDRLTQVTLPDDSSIRYVYDAYHLKQVDRLQNGQVIYSHSYKEYDLRGDVLLEETLEPFELHYEYDLLGRTVRTNSPFWKESILYNEVGLPTYRHTLDADLSSTYSYAYDDLYQLTSDSKHTYCYDSLCNRVSKDQTFYTVNDLNQLTHQNDQNYKYDSDGNLLQDTERLFSYDALGRLTEIKQGEDATQYSYDGFHRRINKIHRGEETNFLYQGD
ncbi:DUF6531 domain-containing protein, partial [Criblamydia sequanensis]|uniref:DUF6531 domain-containing protein n=1 Tax=Candidatus Criblamydia sequanensis TaxID=340071 RepID=UPI0012AC0CED